MIRRLIVLTGMLVLIPLFATPAYAQYNPVFASVNKPVVLAGGTIRVSASGFQRRTDVTIYFDGVQVETSSVRRNGNTSILIDVPTGLAPGTVVTVTVVGTAKGDGTQTATTSFTIKADQQHHGHGHDGNQDDGHNDNHLVSWRGGGGDRGRG